MKKGTVMLSLAFMLVLALPSVALEMDTGVGVVKEGNIGYYEKDWARLEVQPETAFSPWKIKNFTQTLTVCNKAEDQGWLFFNYYFDSPLKGSKVTRVDKRIVNETFQSPIENCYETGKSPNNQTVCEVTGYENKTRSLYVETRTPMPNPSNEAWGGKANYVAKQGSLFEGKECRQYEINYQTSELSGKWNFQVWGNTKDDWTCIQSNTCPYSYTLDPTFSTAFAFKKQLNYTNTGPSLNNFTLGANFTSSTLDTTHVQADGDDVIFVNFDETVQLGCYKETFNPAGIMNWSVLIPNFSNSTPTTVWMYYGNSTITNQCYEPNNAYLLADNMTSAAINTTVWNQLQGLTWAATGTSYTSTTTAGEACTWSGASGNNRQQNCTLIANTSGILKQSQAMRIDTDVQFSTAACGYETYISNGTGAANNLSIGTINASWWNHDQRTVVLISQNTTLLNSAALAAALGRMNQSFRRTTSSSYGVYEYWDNNPGAGAALTLRTNAQIPSPGPSFLNQSSQFSLYHNDFSGATACVDTWRGIRVRGYMNETPTVVIGTEQNVLNPPINLTVSNETWETTGLFDAGGISNYSINVTIDQNYYNNISQVNFSINGQTYRDSQIQNVTSTTSGQTNWTVFNISVYTPLVQTNNTAVSFNWSFQVTGNGSGANVMGNSSNRTQNVRWGWYVNNFTYVSPITSGHPNYILVNFTKHVPTRPTIYNNVTLEWNQTNKTTVGLVTNATGYEDWNYSFTTPIVYVTTSVQMKGWLNISFNGSYVTRDPNATQVIIPLFVNGTVGYEDPVYEIGVANYTLNVTWNANDVNNISNVNLTYNNTVFVGGFVNSSGQVAGNIFWTQFNISLRPNLTQTNASNYTFQWNITVNTNASNMSNSTNFSNQSILFSQYLNNYTWSTPVIEGQSNVFNLIGTSAICESGLSVTPTITGTIEYNLVNQSQVSNPAIVGCATTFQLNPLTMTAPTVSANTVFPFKGWINVTFLGIQRNRNFSNQTQLVLDDGSISNETYNTPIYETSLANFTLNVSNFTTRIVNVNFTWNATQYNGTDITNASVDNTTTFNITIRIPLVPSNQSNYSFRWNYTLNTGENKSSNLTNQTVLWAWYPNKLDLQSDIYELFPQTAGVNVTKHLFIDGTVDEVKVEYNLTNHSTTLTSNQTFWEDWNVTFITPGVSSDLSVQARGILNISFGGIWYLRFTSNASQVIRNVNLSCGRCFNTTSNFTAVLNFSFFDEFSNASIAENGSSSITLWTTLQSVNQTFGCNFVNATFHELCIQNMAANFTANFNVQYGPNLSNQYPVREFWKRQQQVSNTTSNFSLYNLVSGNATEVVVTVQDAARIALRNMIVEAHKYNISNNSYMLVDSGLTDFDGKTRLQLYKADDYYKFVVRDGADHVVLQTSQNPGFKLLFTEYFLIVTPDNATTIGSLIEIRDIERNLTFDNGTKTFALSYLDLNNVTDNYCMEVINTTGYNSTILNKQCSSNRSASFSFNIGNVNGTYQARFTVETAGGNILVEVRDALLNVLRTLGKDAYFGAFILVGTISAAGLFVNPAIGLGLLAFGMGGLYWMNLIPMSWVGISSIIAVIIITALVVRKSI